MDSSKLPPFKPAKLPSFKSKSAASQEEERKGGAVVLTGGAAAAPTPVEMPLLKSRGRSSGGGFSILDRARSLKPHELAFAAAGLAVLLMAPLLDYLVSTPDEAATMGKGLGSPGLNFGDAGETSEVGMNGIARGGAVDGKEESLITPLDHPDPLNLVMVHEGDKDKADGKVEGKSTEPESKPADSPAPTTESWKDAITAAKAGVKQAVSRASGLPRPTAKLEGQIRGLAALQGGGSGGATTAAAIKLDAPAASKNLVGSPSSTGSLSRVSVMPAFKGVASGGGSGLGSRPTGGAGGTGSNSLLEQVAGGSGQTNFFGQRGGGMPDGGATANPAASSSKDAKTTTTPTTENLALLRQKQEMEQAIKLKYDKKRYDQIERKKMIEQIATQTAFQTAQQAALKLLDKALNPQGQQGNQGGQGGGQGNQGAGNPGAGAPPATASTLGAVTPPPVGASSAVTAPNDVMQTLGAGLGGGTVTVTSPSGAAVPIINGQFAGPVSTISGPGFTITTKNGKDFEDGYMKTDPQSGDSTYHDKNGTEISKDDYQAGRTGD